MLEENDFFQDDVEMSDSLLSPTSPPSSPSPSSSLPQSSPPPVEKAIDLEQQPAKLPQKPTLSFSSPSPSPISRPLPPVDCSINLEEILQNQFGFDQFRDGQVSIFLLK